MSGGLISGGLMLGGLKSGGLKSGGLMSGGLKSEHHIMYMNPLSLVIPVLSLYFRACMIIYHICHVLSQLLRILAMETFYSHQNCDF